MGGRTLNATARALELVDYRQRVAALYQLARASDASPRERWARFRAQRDELFTHHPCSPLAEDDRHRGEGVPYFPYDPAARVLATGQDAPGAPFEMTLQEDGVLHLARLAWLSFELYGERLRLALYRLLGYGGGLFLPFRDRTAGDRTYGGGRFLIDTLKHADLGTEHGRLVLDFNFAYHPSCAYSPRWDCPLAPPENRLEVAIRAGECLPASGWAASRA